MYRDALSFALQSKGIRVDREKAVHVRFRGQVVGIFRTDLVVQDSVIVELKCARTIDRTHEAQLLNYLKATEFEVGLLLNFGIRPQFRRMLLDNDQKKIRENPRESVVDAVSSQRTLCRRGSQADIHAEFSAKKSVLSVSIRGRLDFVVD